MKKSQDETNFLSMDLKEFLPQKLIHISPFSPSLHYSHAIFEGMSLIKTDGRLLLFHPWLNIERMRHNSKEVGIDMSKFSDKKIIENIFTLAILNGFHKGRLKSPVVQRANKCINRFYVRPLLFVESDSLGLGAKMRPRFLMGIKQMGEYINYDVLSGINVILYPKPRILPFSSIKTTSNYQLGIISRMKMNQYNQRYQRDCVETLFFNQNNDLIEGSGENIVLLRENELISPAPKEGAIPGITLRMLTMIAKKNGFKFRFGTFQLKDLDDTDCLFFTGNAAGMIPISNIDAVSEKFFHKKTHKFQSASNKSFRFLREEYEKMEIGEPGYEKFHTELTEWVDEKEQSRLYSCASRFLQKIERMDRKGICNLSGNGPMPHACTNQVQNNGLIKMFGMQSFYG